MLKKLKKMRMKMKTRTNPEQVFNGLWDLFYTLETQAQRNKFEFAAQLLVELFPEEEWNDD